MIYVIGVTGEGGGAEFLRTWGAGFDQEGAGAGGRGGGWTSGVAQSLCGYYKSYSPSRTTSEEETKRSRV